MERSARADPATPSTVSADAALTLRRNLLVAAGDGSLIQERIDCAELADALGLHEAALALRDLVFIRTGFSPRQLRWQASLVHGRDQAESNDEPARTGFSIDVAVAELRRLIAATEPPSPEPDWPVAIHGLMAAFATHRARNPERPAPPDTFELCGRLRRQLQETCPPADLAALLDQLSREFADGPPRSVEGDVADPDAIVAALIAADLRDFLLRNAALAFPPFGSAGLFHATARLEGAALGAYLTNVARLIRDSRDVPGLVQLACDGGAESGAIDRWTILLATHLPTSTLADLVDELGDRNLMHLLWQMLYMVVRDLPWRRDFELLWRIRDAALDNRGWRLAASAQRAAALWTRDDPVEWRILADICVTAGDRRGARLALLLGLRASRDDTEMRERLGLLDGSPERFIVTGGYGTAPDRRLRRQARHRVVPAPSGEQEPGGSADRG